MGEYTKPLKAYVDATREVLREYPKAREDDHWLVYLVLTRKLGFKVYMPYKDFKRMPSFETITRCRRKIQNDERLYQSDDAIFKMRKERERQFRREMPKPSKDWFDE